MLKTLGLKEIERIFSITDALGISREALIIPLRTENRGHVRRLRDGKLEIVAAREDDFERWLTHLEAELRAMGRD